MVGELIGMKNMSNCLVGVHNQFFECAHLPCNCLLKKHTFVHVQTYYAFTPFLTQPLANHLFPEPSRDAKRQLDGQSNAAIAQQVCTIK